jgi:hypothetical protein
MKWRSRALPKQKETGKAKKVRNVLQSFFFPSYLISEAYLQSVPRYTLATTRTPPVYCTVCFLTSNTSTYATFISEVQLNRLTFISNTNAIETPTSNDQIPQTSFNFPS